MKIDRRQLACAALLLGSLAAAATRAETADEAAVLKNVEAFRQAQVAKDAKALAALSSDSLATATPTRMWRIRRPL